MSAVQCAACDGWGWVPSDDTISEFARVAPGWRYEAVQSKPCQTCCCHDCGTGSGEYEVVERGFGPVAVCVECAVMSGDDALQAHQEHCHCEPQCA